MDEDQSVDVAMKPNRGPRWVSTPARGKRLRRCGIVSCGKRGTIEFQFDDGGEMVSGFSEHVAFVAVEGVRQSFRAIDDANVELVFEPADNQEVIVEVADVDYWLDEDPSARFVKTGSNSWDLNAAFDFRIGFRVAT